MAHEGVERRLAAILAADVVGYSRLMAADEEGTLSRLQALRTELIDPTIAKHHGRIVKLMGDGALVEFPSVFGAVACAAQLQRSLAEHDTDVPDRRRIRFRIGVNSGDVIVDGDDIYGDGVNVTARMETLAEPGGICVSAKVFDEVRRQPDLGFADLGEQQVKNIPEPIRAYRVLLDSAQAGTVVDARGEPPSLAVLPFDNLSRDYFLSYVSDGLTEDLINALARLPSLPVIVREASFAHRGRSDQVDEVARELAVTHVLEGSVRCTERRLEVDARLIDGAQGDPVWSDRFDRPRHDLVSIRNEIVASVGTALNLPLSDDDRARLASKPTAKLEAHDLLLRAREMRASATRAMVGEAIRTLEEAVALDADFALGWSELAVTLRQAADAGWTDSAEASGQRALEAAERGVALDPSLGPAHTVLGAILQGRGETERALRELEAGVAACPNAAWPVAMLGRHLPDHGRPSEGLQMMERAFRLNPGAPGWYFEARGWARFALRCHDEAVADFGEATQLAPDDLGPRLGLIVGHAAAGRLDEARAAAEEVLRIAPELTSNEARAEVADPVLRERQAALLRHSGLPGGVTQELEAQEADALLDHWITTFNANLPPNLDPDALANLYAVDCINIQPLRELPGGPYRGRDAMRRFFATFDSHWSTLTMIEVSRVTQGRRAVWEAVMEGIHKKSGKPVAVPIVFFIDFDQDGKDKEQHTYVDNGLVEEQIR